MMFLRKARDGSDYKSEILPQIQGMSNSVKLHQFLLSKSTS